MIAGREVYAACAACHGQAGEGGAGPSLAGVRETFPACDDHIRWIRLGTERWQEEVGPSYGTADTEITRVMPAFDSLDETQLSQIAMYERVRFGGGDLESERAECGLPPLGSP